MELLEAERIYHRWWEAKLQALKTNGDRSSEGGTVTGKSYMRTTCSLVYMPDNDRKYECKTFKIHTFGR